MYCRRTTCVMNIRTRMRVHKGFEHASFGAENEMIYDLDVCNIVIDRDNDSDYEQDEASCKNPQLLLARYE